jgi:site-specific recombinase XerD
MLEQAICDYLQWLKSQQKGSEKARLHYEEVLNDFALFVRNKRIAREDTFSLDTLKAFRKNTKLTNVSRAVRGLSYYLFLNGTIPQPLRIPNHQIDLPEIYEQYLLYHEQSRQLPYMRIKPIRRVLAAFHDYLQRDGTSLSCLRIEQVDAFLAQLNKPLAPGSSRVYRFYLRGFLKYLYKERKIISRDLAPLVVGRRLYAQAKPPKFLRPQEIQKLFCSLKLSSPVNIRNYAMVHLAYSLGLRPVEICGISLDDISFKKKELTLRGRKGNNPTRLPIPEHTIKAIAAYVIGVRPNTKYRALFLTLKAPYKPMSPALIAIYIKECMKEAGLCGSAYWLRHTYAQNLLESGLRVFEIKEMMGHDKIESTKHYLHIHIKLMREVLFDEEL